MAESILLASQSPQRSALLQASGIPFTVVPSTTDESSINLPHPQACAVERAVAKALGVPRDVVGDDPQAVILAADTVASLDGAMIGKPRDREHARRTLEQLQGTTHVVSTAHCLLKADGGGTMSTVQAVGVAVAKVTMLPMSAEQIGAYLDGGEWEGRAGAYAIQETGDRYVADLEGEFDTVVGLNIATVRRLYHELTSDHLPGGEVDA